MKRKSIEQKHITKTGISSLIIFTIIFSISANAKDYDIPWMTYICAINNVAYLTSDANARIQMVDWGDDVAACATLYIASGGDSEWTFEGDSENDGCVTSIAEEKAFDKAAEAEGYNAFRLVEWNVTFNFDGFAHYYGIVVMDCGNSGTLAHEFGHTCGITDHNTEGKIHRIMNSFYHEERCTLNSTEAAHFENGY